MQPLIPLKNRPELRLKVFNGSAIAKKKIRFFCPQIIMGIKQQKEGYVSTEALFNGP